MNDQVKVEFKIGDVVVLRSAAVPYIGSPNADAPNMTIDMIVGEMATCQWFHYGELCTGNFNVATLGKQIP